MAKSPNLVAARHWICHVAFEGRFNPIKTNTVVAAAHQRHIFGVRPAKRHRRPGGATPLHAAVLQILGVPKLFTDHSAFVCELLHRGDERLRIASRSQFVMATFSRQNRPTASYARAVEGVTVVLLPVPIVIVPPPARALRQVPFD